MSCYLLINDYTEMFYAFIYKCYWYLHYQKKKIYKKPKKKRMT